MFTFFFQNIKYQDVNTCTTEIRRFVTYLKYDEFVKDCRLIFIGSFAVHDVLSHDALYIRDLYLTSLLQFLGKQHNIVLTRHI